MRNAIVSLTLGLTLSMAPPVAAGVIYTDTLGNNWRDLTDTGGVAWDDLDFLCPNDGISVCSGLVAGNGVADVTGWTWATRDQVLVLFRELTGLTFELNDYEHMDFLSTWAPAALALFPGPGGADFSMGGWSATPYPNLPGWAFLPFIVNGMGSSPDEVHLNFAEDTSTQFPGRGAFLFQPAPVPEPATLTLVLSGIAWGFTRRYLRKRS